jgi:hypothetical protein
MRIKFKLVKLSPMRIPPQQEAARRLVVEMRRFPIATYLNDLIHRNQPNERQLNEFDPRGPLPVEPALADAE